MLAASGLLEASLLAPGIKGPDQAAEFRRVRDKGVVGFDKAVEAVDGLGVGHLHDPRAPRREDASDRPHRDLPLPPPPTPAAKVKPFVSATSIVAASKDPAPPGTPGAEAPLSRCNLRQAEREGCDAGGAPPKPLTPPIELAPARP